MYCSCRILYCRILEILANCSNLRLFVWRKKIWDIALLIKLCCFPRGYSRRQFNRFVERQSVFICFWNKHFQEDKIQTCASFSHAGNTRSALMFFTCNANFWMLFLYWIYIWQYHNGTFMVWGGASWHFGMKCAPSTWTMDCH